jgi:uncharacterized RDD family membrane protein YckC
MSNMGRPKVPDVALRVLAGARTIVVAFAMGLGASILFFTCVPVEAYLVKVYQVTQARADIAAGILVWCPAMLWHTWNGTVYRASYGMKRTGLRWYTKRHEEGSHLRTGMRACTGIICVPLAPVSWITCLSNKDRRSLADLICGTVCLVHEDNRGG